MCNSRDHLDHGMDGERGALGLVGAGDSRGCGVESTSGLTGFSSSLCTNLVLNALYFILFYITLESDRHQKVTGLEFFLKSSKLEVYIKYYSIYFRRTTLVSDLGRK